MTTKGYKRLLAGASATCFAMGLILLPTAAFASGKGSGAANGVANGVANGLDKKTAPTATTTTTTAAPASTPTGTLAPQTTSVTGSLTTLPPQPLTKNEVPGGPGANNQTNNPYASNGVGLPSGNGNQVNGGHTGEPCAGCVGKADNKNPPGQAPGPSDNNAGYECDRNHGIARTNPAHTGCKTAPTSPTTPPPTTPTTVHHGCTSNCGGCTSNCGGCTSNCHDPGTTTVPTGCVSGSSSTSCGTTTPSLAAGHGSSTTTRPATSGASTTVAPATVGSAVKASSGGLAFTGANMSGEFLAGGLALAAGIVLLGASRRQRPAAAEMADGDDGPVGTD